MDANEAHTERRSAVLYSRAAIAADSVSEESRSVDVIVSTADIDGHGTIVRQNWQLERFLANPVVLYSHDSDELPIGTASSVGILDGQLRARITFSTADLNPMAEQVWQNVRAKVIRGISAGFCPHSITSERANDREIIVLDDNELFEISVCPVPSNAQALAQIRSMASRAAVPYKATPPDSKDAWDGAAAEQRIRAWATTDGEIDFKKYRQGFAWYDPNKPDSLGSYKLPHHDVADGTLVTMRGGVIAAGNACMGSRGGVDIPDGEMAAVKAHLAKHYAQFDMKPPWAASTEKSMAVPEHDEPQAASEPVSPPPQAVGQPAKREGADTMSDQNRDHTNTVTVARALDLPVGATEQDVLSAVVRLRTFEVQILAVANAKSGDEAIGAVRGMASAAKDLVDARKELAEVKAERDAQKFDALVRQGVAEYKLTPAEEKYERDLFAQAIEQGRGAARIAELSGLLRVKTPDARFSREVKQPESRGGSGTPLLWNGKSYAQLSYSERAALSKENKDLWRLMKVDHESAQGAH